MNADQARSIAQLSTTPSETALVRLQDIIDTNSTAERNKIGAKISEAAHLGHLSCTYVYIERISARINSPDDIAFIEDVARIVSAIVVKDLQIDGFKVLTTENEKRDYRDATNAPPEYFDTTFNVRWDSADDSASV